MCELINYWHYLGVDQASLGKIYLDVIKTIEEGQLIVTIYSSLQ